MTVNKAIIVGAGAAAAGVMLHKAIAEGKGDLIMGAETYDELKAAAMKDMGIADKVNMTVNETEIISEFPDRLCIEHKSRFFSTSCPYVGVKISVEGAAQYESNDIVEYCLSGRWIRLGRRDAAGNLVRHRSGFECTRIENVDITLYWRYDPSRQVRRALKRIGA